MERLRKGMVLYMTCKETQSRITPFIHDQLNLKEMEAFIEHVQSCKECREELEVYYALLTAMEQLDEDRTLSDNYNMELDMKIEREQEKIVHAKFLFYRKKIRLVIVILMIVLLLSFRYTNNHIQPRDLLSRSTFRMRIMFQGDEETPLDTDLKKYLEKQTKEQKQAMEQQQKKKPSMEQKSDTQAKTDR
jgi:hypothetical protein